MSFPLPLLERPLSAHAPMHDRGILDEKWIRPMKSGEDLGSWTVRPFGTSMWPSFWLPASGESMYTDEDERRALQELERQLNMLDEEDEAGEWEDGDEEDEAGDEDFM